MKKFLFILLLSFTALQAQTDDDIIFIIGDSLKGKVINGESIREVMGNVIMTQDNIRITCNLAIQNITRNEAELIGNVVVTQDTITILTEKGYYFGNDKYTYSDTGVTLDDGHMVLIADEGYYYFNTKVAVFNQNVELIDTINNLSSDKLTYYNDLDKAVAVDDVTISSDKSTIYSDSLIHFRESNTTYAFKNITIENSENQMVITGEELIDEGELNYTKITGDPLLVKVDTSKSGQLDTLFIRSLMMESIEDSTNRLIATDSVIIIRGEFTSSNDISILYRDDDKIFTYKREDDLRSPVLWYTTSQLVGDSIDIYLDENQLDWIDIKKDALIISRKEGYDLRYDQISGDNIKLYFSNEGIEKTEVIGDVLSIYFIFEENEPNGLLKSSSNKAKMIFDDNKVIDVKLYGSIESEYHPENLIEGNELDFTLPSFFIYKFKPNKKDIYK
ncbi:MAG: LPS export ABC transporter periplasmic protein LptC [Melioribacteraceae bacterium]|nr:LPS export ABC transporter periplasmic protein LptC [Melioribacteraceae bacterium]